MTPLTWVGGTHRITDPGVWTPNAIAAGDLGSVPSGHVVAINQTLGNYAISLDGGPTAATLDALGSTITGSLGGLLYAEDGIYNPGAADRNSDGTAAFLARTVNNGFIGTYGDYLGYTFPQLNIVIADVTTPAGIVVQQGVLVNNGTIGSGDTDEPVTITSPSSDAILVNNGTIGDRSDLAIDVPISGTGIVSPGIRDFNSVLTFSKAVSAGQTVEALTNEIMLVDPLSFQATIAGFRTSAPELSITMPQEVSSAAFADHLLTLRQGSVLVAQLRFTDDVTAADILVNSGPGGTTLTAFNPILPSTGNVAVTTGGTPPSVPPITLPAGPSRLPAVGPNLTFTTGAHVAAIQKLDDYLIGLYHADAVRAAPLSVDITSVVFGSRFELLADAGFGQTSSSSLDAVGYNENDGLIATGHGHSSQEANFTIALSDVVSPTGTVVLAGAYNNVGTIDAANGSALTLSGTVDSKLINAGTVIANGLTFIGPTVTGTGTFQVGNAIDGLDPTSLEFGGEVSTAQSIRLTTGTLVIDDPKQFFATITPLDPGVYAVGDVLLRNIQVSSIAYDNGRLSLDGGAEGTLHFHGRFTTSSFELGSSSLGTDIRITLASTT